MSAFIGFLIGFGVGLQVAWCYWRRDVLALRRECEEREKEVCRLVGAPYQTSWDSLRGRWPIPNDPLGGFELSKVASDQFREALKKGPCESCGASFGTHFPQCHGLERKDP